MKLCLQQVRKTHRVLVVLFVSQCVFAIAFSLKGMDTIVQTIKTSVGDALKTNPKANLVKLEPVINNYIVDGLKQALTELPKTLEGRKAQMLAQAIIGAKPDLDTTLKAAVTALGETNVADLTPRQVAGFTRQLAQAIENFVARLKGSLAKEVTFDKNALDVPLRNLTGQLNLMIAAMPRTAY